VGARVDFVDRIDYQYLCAAVARPGSAIIEQRKTVCQ
jgi:hypothetical protein